MSDRFENRLKTLLAVPHRAPDEAFTARVQRAVAAEERMRSATRSAWRRFAAELAATLAVLAVFWLLWRFVPVVGDEGAPVNLGPAAAGLLTVFLFVATAFRPAASR